MAGRTAKFYGELRSETVNAWLIHDGINDIWIAKSQMRNMRNLSGDDYEFEVPEWLAKKKGIV